MLCHLCVFVYLRCLSVCVSRYRLHFSLKANTPGMLHACGSSSDLPGILMRQLITAQSLQLPIMGLCRVEEEAGFVILTKRCQIRWRIFQQQSLLLLQDLQSRRMHVSAFWIRCVCLICVLPPYSSCLSGIADHVHVLRTCRPWSLNAHS